MFQLFQYLVSICQSEGDGEVQLGHELKILIISPVGEDVGTVEGDKHSDNNLHHGQDHFPLFKLFKVRHFSRLIITPVHALETTSLIDCIAQVARSQKVLIQIWLVGDHC